MKSNRSLIWIIGAFSLLMPLFAARAQTQDVDVMILYDRSAQTWLYANHGGSYLANANLAIAKLNQAMTNSGVSAVNYRLCHFGVIDTNLPAIGGLVITNVMPYVRDPSNRVTDVLYPWRATMSADLVAIMVNGFEANSEAGVADAPATAAGDSNMAFSISIIPNTEIDDTLTHAIGRNMGCGYSKYGTPPGPGVFPYAAGWYFQGSNGLNYHTVCAIADDGYGFHYNMTAPSIFSTPGKKYLGIRVGDATDGDNVTCLTNMVPVIGTYLTPVADTPPSAEISSPFCGDVIPATGGDTYPVFVETMDPDGTITHVDFYRVNNYMMEYPPVFSYVGTSWVPTTNSPNLYEFDMPKVGWGTNWLWCVAWDNGGNAWMSATNWVFEEGTRPRPTVELLYNPPIHHAPLPEPAPTNGWPGLGWRQHGWVIKDIAATASSEAGFIDHVEFYRTTPDGVVTTFIGQASIPPYTISWRCPSVPISGEVTNYIYCRSMDNYTIFSHWSVTNVVVTGPNIPPYVDILSPEDGTTQSWHHVNIVTDAHTYDIDDSITQMVFYVDGLAAAGGTFTQKVDSFTWMPPGLGAYTLTVAVWDEDGVCVTSPPAVLNIGGDQPPTIAITTPTNGAVLSGNWVSIMADASDPDDSVASVQFLVDGSPIATFTSSPYSTNSPTLSIGLHTLSAVAVDELGLTATSSVTVTSGANPPPIVTIIAPTNNAQISNKSPAVTLQCTAVASVGQITSVVFYVDGALVGTTTGSPYSVSMPTPGIGAHVTTVAALDDSGNCWLVWARWFVVNTPDLSNIHNIDIMVLFDGTARTWLATPDNNGKWIGNADVANTPSLNLAVSNGISFLAFANLKIAEMNLAMLNSGVTNLHYNLVHFGVINTRPFVLYDGFKYESLPFFPDDPQALASRDVSLTNTLWIWKYPTPTIPRIFPDPVYDAERDTKNKIDGWRTTFGADLMAVILDGSDSDKQSGISDLLPLGQTDGDASRVCSISLLPSTELDDTFSHSIGQNMGCGNSKFQWWPGWSTFQSWWPLGWGPGPGVYSYSAGWYFQGTNGLNYHTICASDFDDAGYHYNLTTPRMFSTPLLRYPRIGGIPIGDANDGDNVRSLMNMASAVAAYTNAPGTIPPSVEIVFPAYGAAIHNTGDYFTVRAEVMDPNTNGWITRVDFCNFGEVPDNSHPSVSSATNSLANDPNSYVSFDVLAVHTGVNWLNCVATDNLGNSWTSAYIYVVVDHGCEPTVDLKYNPPEHFMELTAGADHGWSQHGWSITNITATATPSAGWIITNVNFYADIDEGVLIGSVTNSAPGPFTATIQWRYPTPPSAPDSVVTYISARAQDNHPPSGTMSPPSQTNVVVLAPNIPPFVEIVSPTSGTLQWSSNIVIVTDAHAYDIDDTITQMIYYVDANPVATFTQKVESFTYTTSSLATFILRVRVWDDDGATSISPPVQVTIEPNQPPTVTITAPTNGAVLSSRGINIDTTVFDSDGKVAHVDFLVDGINIATATDYPYWIDTWISPSSGVYTLTAVAVDDVGAAGTSTPVVVTTGTNMPPTVTITSPTNGQLVSARAPAVQLACTVTPVQGQVTSVVFFVDKVLVGTVTNAPYGVSISNPGLGNHVTTVEAWDDLGNYRRVSATWVVVPMPDLVITQLKPNPIVPMTGTVFSVMVVIKNIGVAPANNFHVSVWLDMPAVAINDAGEDAGLDVVTSLGTNQTATLFFNGLSVGTNTAGRVLRAFVDSRLVVTEENELNNQLTRNYRPAGAAVNDRIDIMLLYDKTAQTWLQSNHGGSFLANANLVVANLNQAMSNSTVAATYRLVHFGVVDIGYGGNLTNTLNEMLIGQSADAIDTLRGECGADLVALMVNGAADNGHDTAGFVPDSPNGNQYAAFSVSIIPDTEIDETMTRGLAFNMGCGVSKYQSDYPGPGFFPFPYSGGWYFQGTDGVKYHTIMADPDDGYGIQYQSTQPALFSSPNLRYMGVPIGDVNDADNVRCITNMVPFVESYRLDPVNIPPSVEIVSPSEGTSFPSPANSPTIPVWVEAMDADGTVTSVVFCINDVPVDTETNSLTDMPNVFSNNVPNLTSGSNRLYTVAWDNSGGCWTSAVVSISVASNMPPEVVLTCPLDGASQHGLLITNISATASDSDGSITSVEFHASSFLSADYLIGVVTNSPYTIASWVCPWNTGNISNIAIWAVAWDNEGARTSTKPSQINMGPDIPPFVEILSPTNGATTWKTNITITAAANAYDIDDVITQVVFYVDGTSNVGTFAGAPCTCTWMAPGQGAYTLTAVAWASDNQCSTSRPVVLNITTNSPPVITIASATNTASRRISIIANATDPNDDISNVVFRVYGNAVGTNAYYPYAYTWLSPSSGVYDVSAVVMDQGGLAATSATITVRCGTNLTPALAITAPVNNYVFSNTTATLKFQTTVTDPASVITTLLFYVNGVLTDAKTTAAAIKAGAWQTSNPGIGDYETTVEALLTSGDPQFATIKWRVRDMRPDFQIVSIALNPSAPYVGQTFSAVVTVTNAGETAGNAGTLSVWTNHPADVAWGFGANGTNIVGTLAAHTSKAVTFTGFSSGLVNSTGRTFRAFVDSMHVTSEPDESNNQMTTNYDVRIKSDLVVSLITLDPLVPSTGYVFNAAVVLKNQGHGVASNFHVSVWANMAAVPTDSTGESQGADITSLDPGQVVTNVFLGLNASTGKVVQTFRVFVDSTNGVNEELETNNQLTKTYTPSGHAEFWVTAISLTPTNPVVGKTFTAIVTVTNTGSISASAGNLYVWADKPGVVAVKTAADKSASVGTLNKGAGKTVTITGLTAGTAGTKTFRAFIDAAGATTEMIETNNQTTLSYNVITMADLAISGITLAPSVPARGGVFTASVTVTNIGSATATGVYVSVWANMAAVPINNAGADDESMVGNIGANQSYLYTTVLDAGTGTVSRTFRAFADSTLVVTEWSETNNQKTVVYKPASRPDFMITGITLSSTNPPVGSTNMWAQVMVTNVGYASGNGGYVDVWADRATSVVPNATNRGDKYASVGTLAVNGGKTLLFTGLNVGTNTLQRIFRALVDSRALTPETVETNNEGTATYTPQ